MAEIPALVKVTAAKATAIAALLKLPPEATALLAPDHTPGAFVGALLAADRLVDAIRFLAHALPKWDAVRWAAGCVREALGPEPDALQKAALESAERWLKQPSLEHARQAKAAGEAADMGTPGGCVAGAAFFSGPNIAPADDSTVIPPPGPLGPGLAAAAIIVAAVLPDPAAAHDKFRRYLHLGIDWASRPPKS